MAHLITDQSSDEDNPLDVVIDADTSGASKAFLTRLRGTCSPVAALLYGSRARGDHATESDIDIAVILKGSAGDRYGALRGMSDAAFDILLETGLHIQPLPLWESELAHPELCDNPALIEAIRRDGIEI